MSARIMAIINTSPDSFAGDGVEVGDARALHSRLETALAEGADILDIGGQSTRPGAEIIDEATEIARVVPAIAAARKLTAKPISVDTFKPAVARAALAAGATMVNDITGAADAAMITLVKDSGADVVVMHMRGTPQTMSKLTDYPRGVVGEVTAFLRERTAGLVAAGIARGRIIVDPGIGFAKTASQSYELTLHLDELVALGFPVLYGGSGKSFIGKALAIDGQAAPVEDRAVGTVVVQSQALLQGAAIIRVHDVAAAVQTRAVVEALQGHREIPA